jgi:hypothetical protein
MPNVPRQPYLERFDDWNPFPDAWVPAEYEANANLLGYHRPHQLHQELVEKLRRYQFANDGSMLGRLSHCPEVLM